MISLLAGMLITGKKQIAYQIHAILTRYELSGGPHAEGWIGGIIVKACIWSRYPMDGFDRKPGTGIVTI